MKQSLWLIAAIFVASACKTPHQNRATLQDADVPSSGGGALLGDQLDAIAKAIEPVLATVNSNPGATKIEIRAGAQGDTPEDTAPRQLAAAPTVFVWPKPTGDVERDLVDTTIALDAWIKAAAVGQNSSDSRSADLGRLASTLSPQAAIIDVAIALEPHQLPDGLALADATPADADALIAQLRGVQYQVSNLKGQAAAAVLAQKAKEKQARDMVIYREYESNKTAAADARGKGSQAYQDNQYWLGLYNQYVRAWNAGNYSSEASYPSNGKNSRMEFRSIRSCIDNSSDEVNGAKRRQESANSDADYYDREANSAWQRYQRAAAEPVK